MSERQTVKCDGGKNNLHGENMSERQTVKYDGGKTIFTARTCQSVKQSNVMGGNNLHGENMLERQTVKCDGGEQSSRREHVRASNSQM